MNNSQKTLNEPNASSRCIHHQRYYTLPNGIECIKVIRYFPCNIGMAIKYLWRAGKKTEAGIPDRDKAIEDLKKAIVCIEEQIDYLSE